MNDTDLGRLRDLLAKDVDNERCTKCSKWLGVAPTVFVLFPDDTPVLYAAGDELVP